MTSLWPVLVAALVGLVQAWLVAGQGIRINQAGVRPDRVFMAQASIAAVWCAGVSAVITGPAAASAYIVASAIGATTAFRQHDRRRKKLAAARRKRRKAR